MIKYDEKYNIHPYDYENKLRKKGFKGRKKARCFCEYMKDLSIGERNTMMFYSESWEMSVGTVHKWVQEFKAVNYFFEEYDGEVCQDA